MYAKKTREVRLSQKEIKKKSQSSSKVEFRFIGTPRSGMNTIAKWMLSNFKGYSFYSTKPLDTIPTDTEFYTNLIKRIVTNKKNLIARNKGDSVGVGFCWDGFPIQKCIRTPSVQPTRFNVLVLRDPFNQFASIEKTTNVWEKRNLTAREYIKLRELWISHAQVFKNKNEIWDGKVLRILFDRWVTDPDYRKEILNVASPFLGPITLDIDKKYSPTPFDNISVMKRFDDMMKHSLVCRAIYQDTTIKTFCTKIFGWSK